MIQSFRSPKREKLAVTPIFVLAQRNLRYAYETLDPTYISLVVISRPWSPLFLAVFIRIAKSIRGRKVITIY